MEVLKILAMVLLLTLAVASDSKHGSIPNELNIAMSFLGTFCSGIGMGIAGAAESILGIIIPAVLLYLLFVIKAMGAGDIKLFSAMGAWLHLDVLYVIFISFVVIGAYALIRSFIRAVRLLQNRHKDRNTLLQYLTVTTRVHLSPFITMATIIYFVGGWWYGL